MSRFLRMITLAAFLGASLAAPAPIARRQCSTSVSTVDPTPTVPPVTLPTVSTDAPETTPVSSSSSDTPPAEPTDTPVPSPAPEDVPPAGGSADPDMVCNGDARLCDRKYSDVVFVGTHNSYALDGAGGLPGLANAASNQFIDVPAQLGMGIRFLQSQTHVKKDSLHVCHTSCDLYDGGSLEDYLKGVSAFLNEDANKNEVVTLLITNPENYPLEKWPDIFKAAGLDGLVYTPASVPGTRADWPTMRELISANTRVVVLMDYNADTSKVSWILPEFDVMWESKFDEVDASFPCGVDRVNGDAGPKLGLINHYLDSEFLGILIPDRDAASTTNSVDSITAQVNNCAALGDAFKVTHVLLDWADKGQAIETARKLNGLE